MQSSTVTVHSRTIRRRGYWAVAIIMAASTLWGFLEDQAHPISIDYGLAWLHMAAGIGGLLCLAIVLYLYYRHFPAEAKQALQGPPLQLGAVMCWGVAGISIFTIGFTLGYLIAAR